MEVLFLNVFLILFILSLTNTQSLFASDLSLVQDAWVET